MHEAAEVLELPKSDAHELGASLARIGLLRRTPPGRYQLGRRLLTIRADLLGRSSFEAPPHRVTDRYLGKPSPLAPGMDCTSCASRVLRVPGRDYWGRRSTLPGHATALGKLLMSSLPWETTMSIIERHGLPRYTAATVAGPPELESQLEAARRTGRAHEYGYMSKISRAWPEFFTIAAIWWRQSL